MLKAVVFVTLLSGLPGVALAADWGSPYAKVYGGLTPEDSQFAGVQDYDLEQGSLFGAAFGLATQIPGLALELDLSHSRANYVGDGNALEATLVMANAVYTMPVAGALDVYAGAGLGGAFVLDDCITSDTYDADGQAFAGQAFLGASVTLAEGLSVFGELRYQSAVGRVTVTDRTPDTYGVDFARAAVVAGVKFAL